MERTPPPAAEIRRPYKVFVSSTFLDNQERRKLVQDAITMAGMVWHGMEIFTASTHPTVEVCLRYASEADLLVGIIAWRYGWEPDGNKSITEMEYEAAKQRLMFLIDPELPVNPERDFDSGPERWKKQEKLEAFKARIRNDHTPASFTEMTLQAKVLSALNKWSKPDTEKRRIDAVGPAKAAVGRTMDVFVQVRFPDSEYLSIRDWPFKSKPSSIERVSKLANIKFRRIYQGILNPAYVKLKVVAPEFKVEGETEKILEIPWRKFSELISFQLIPRLSGTHRIIISVYDEDGFSVGELPVETDVNEIEIAAREAILVILRLNVMVSTAPASPHLFSHAVDEDLEEEIRQYIKKADSLHSTLPVAGFVTQLKVPIDIEEIYVPLNALLDLRGFDEGCFPHASEAEVELRKSGAALEIALPEAFNQCANRKRRGVVILGDPGAGKTTHVKRLLLACLRKGTDSIGLPRDMLPVFLPLRNLRDLEHGLDRFIQDELTNTLKTSAEFGERLLKRGNLLFLLDGLDEVSDRSQRKQVVEWIDQSLRLYTSCWFVVTSRFAGYTPDVHLGADFLETHIRPLTEEQVGRFVHNWYRIVERGLAKDPEQAEGIAREEAEQLIKRLGEPDFRTRRLFEMTRNPMLLTNICLVQRHRGQLPQKRARLYKECIDVLLEHWRGSVGLSIGVTAEEGRKVLQPAALWLHSEPERKKATAKELSPLIEPVLKSVGWNRGNAEEFLRTIRDQSGLLTSSGVDQYGFMHLVFQEYLAALEIRSRAFTEQAVLRELARHYGESWWQEVILLMLALADPSLFVQFMREVVRQPGFVTYPDLLEMCLDDAAEVSSLPFIELLKPKFWKRLVELLVTDPGKKTDFWQRQFLALKVLGRIDAGQVDALRAKLSEHPFEELRQWMEERAKQAAQNVTYAKQGGYELVRISAGEFDMGSRASEEGHYEGESPIHKVRVRRFYMGRYPVTNDEYGRFLDKKPDVKPPDSWADRQFNGPRQPVVGVSWKDANSYASWAGLRLPSEAEWEYACRALTSSRFYLGEAEENLKQAGWYANNSDRQTHPVGEKIPNAWGLYDMHGNVWEWVQDDWHGNYKKAPGDGSAWTDRKRSSFRVIRGGGWRDVARDCRSAMRYIFGQDTRDPDVGFRLASSVAIGP